MFDRSLGQPPLFGYPYNRHHYCRHCGQSPDCLPIVGYRQQPNCDL